VLDWEFFEYFWKGCSRSESCKWRRELNNIKEDGSEQSSNYWERERGRGRKGEKEREKKCERNMWSVKPIRREGRTMHKSGGLGKSPAVISAILVGMLKWFRVS